MKATNKYIVNRIMRLVLSLVGFACGVSYASPLNNMTLRLYDQREIVAGNYTTFCNDAEGYLWIGTDAGLMRFDGNHSDIYRNDESDSCSISDNKIVSLFSDSRGDIWVGTVNGLNFYDRASDTFRLVTLPGMQLNGYITDIAELPGNRILFIVAGIGLYVVDASDFSVKGSHAARRYNTGLKDDSSISAMVGVSGQKIVFSTRYGDIFRLSAGKNAVRIGGISGNVSKLAEEDGNHLIFATPYEVFRLDLASGAHSQLKVEGGEKIKITGLHSAGGVSYLSTAASGIWEIVTGSESIRRSGRLFSTTLDLPLLKIGSVFVDNRGNLWMGCNHRGVAIAPASDSPFINKSLNNVFKEFGGEVSSMIVAGEDIAIGTNSGDVLLLDSSGGMRKVSVSRGNPVTSMAAVNDASIIVGVARDGIWEIDLRSLRLSRIVMPAGKYPGVVLSVGAKGEVVAAFGELGVMRYDPVTHNEKWFYPATGSNMLSCFYYAGVSKTADGRIWIGGYSGIACYDPKTDSLVPIDQTPFFKGVVYDVCDYADGVLIATDRGLIQYSDKKGVVGKFTMTDGLPDNDVRTLMRDHNGVIWAGTMRGLAYMKDPGSGIKTLGGRYGLAPTAYVFSDRLPAENKLLIGGYENLVAFCPDSVKHTDFGGSVKITGMFLNGKRLSATSLSGNSLILEGTPGHPEVIHLSHKDNSLVLRLSTLDFRDASDLRYEWQIDGEDDKWHSTSPGESFVYLPPLDSGRHKLRIRGWESDDVSEITEINLDVKAPWYLSNMAYATYILILVMIGGLIYKVVRNKREEELYEAKIRYFMDISHELRSPVTLMLSPVETLLKQEHSPETTSQLLTVRRNAQRVLSLVDQLLDLRKIEKGKMRLVYTPTDIRAFVAELVEMFTPMAEEKRISISFICNEKELWGGVDRNNLDKILVNLITNAIKYTPEGGSVSVELRKDTDTLGSAAYSVTVTDTGIGLDNKMISHLFERFYRGREFHHGNASGFGIGLDLCMRLVELHKGVINAKNREDGVKGSVFYVSLPLNPVTPAGEADGAASGRAVLPVIFSGRGEAVKAPKSSHRFRILVVDDDAELREYIKHNLGGSYKVITVPDAETALRDIREKLPDLIVTDIRMNGIDGFELLHRVKSNMATQHVPVILFSSVNESEERTKGWKRGADGYLAKPFSIEELEGMVSGLLQTRSRLKGTFSGSQAAVDSIEAPKIKGMDEELMNKINRFINENLSETSMNVDSLSEYVGLSRSQLHRRMKEIMGVAPSDYIRNVKLRKACEMLSQGDVDIAQVAYSLGFNTQSHFSTLFKRYTGLTPTDYRNLGREGKLDKDKI